MRPLSDEEIEQKKKQSVGFQMVKYRSDAQVKKIKLKQKEKSKVKK